MRVLNIVKTNEGAAWAFKQSKWLKERGIEIITVLPKSNGGYAEKYKENDMKVINADLTLPLRNPWTLFYKIKKINEIIERTKPDIIHAHFVTNILFLRLALGKDHYIPRLFQVPGPLHLENWIYRKIEIMTAGSKDYWAGACKKTCDIYRQEGISQDRIFLGYYGGYGGKSVDEYLISGNKLRNEFNIPLGNPLIGMVSYFYKPKYHLFQFKGIKGHEDFIEAFGEIFKEVPNAMGVIIGGPWGKSTKYMNKLKKKAIKLYGDKIIFTGFRTDIKEIYKELDIAVHPSLSENLGGAAESLAAGIPTISSNVGGFPDIVINNKTGYTVNKNEPQQLADAIISMLGNKTKSVKMAEAGQLLVKDLLNIENTAKKIKNIYMKIIEGA